MNTSKLVKIFPSPLFDLLISVFNYLQYRKRRAGVYTSVRQERAKIEELEQNALFELQNKRFIELLKYAKQNSSYYRGVLANIEINSVHEIKLLPYLEKKTLVENLDKIKTVHDSQAIASYTGGTTGASMKVLYRYENMQERFAYLDHFRAQFGYELGKRVAWFSGKNLLSERDLQKGRVYKDDYINKIRFFSTFHITRQNVKFYINALVKFRTEYIVGFPSSVFRICKYAEELGISYEGGIKFFFPTAETVTQEHREVIGRYLGCKLVDQYASSEGAPFIFECEEGGLHIDISSGVFEVLDDDGNDAEEGELVVTSFTTKGTPLIRYKVGDRIKLSSKRHCPCGSSFPIAEKIEGRKDDYILSPTHGEVNLGNISNSTKGISGITCFQIEQRCLNNVLVRVVGTTSFTESESCKFVSALKERLGEQMEVKVSLVTEIPVEKSGKFRIIKNYLKVK